MQHIPGYLDIDEDFRTIMLRTPMPWDVCSVASRRAA
jgi:hypothetical protein